jgi:deazaflavin-dependent oxidoreductase (nitroreductase family)
VNPIVYFQPRGDGFAVFASKAGAETNPDWYHNIVANSDVEIEVGAEKVRVPARIAEGDEREVIWTSGSRTARIRRL